MSADFKEFLLGREDAIARIFELSDYGLDEIEISNLVTREYRDDSFDSNYVSDVIDAIEVLKDAQF